MKVLSTLCIAVMVIVVNANANEKEGKNIELITSLYEKALTVNAETTPAEVLNEILASDYKSVGSIENKTKEQLIGQLGFFWKVVPNLQWKAQEILKVAKNRYVVRGMASGNPNGDFMGLATNGSGAFTIMTVDIHTVENGKIMQTYHVEDWATAIRQLTIEKSTDTKSKETMAIAMGFMDAMGKGDMEKMMSLMHEDMVWQNSGDERLPWIGPWKGKKTILEEFMPAFGANFQTIKWDPNDGFASGETAAFFGQMIGLLTKSNEKTKEFTYAIRVKVKDGKVILWNWFEDSYEVSRAYQKK